MTVFTAPFCKPESMCYILHKLFIFPMKLTNYLALKRHGKVTKQFSILLIIL